MFVYYNNFIEKFLYPNQSHYRNRKREVKDIETFNVRNLATMLIFHPKMETFLSGLLEVVDLPSKRKASW